MKNITEQDACETPTAYDEPIFISSITLKIKKDYYNPNYFKETRRKIGVYDCFWMGEGAYSWTLFCQPFLTEYAFNSQF